MLPIRDGINPTQLRLPRDSESDTVLGYLVARFPQDADRLREKVDGGEVVDEGGIAVDAATPYRAHSFVFLYRDLPIESPVPFTMEILHRDDDLLVVDKPHFLASTPRGSYVVQTALVRLRRELDLPELSPAHRLDRLTAGVLVFTVHAAARRPYQMLFADRLMHKEYEAVAPYDPALALPRIVHSRIVKERGVLQAREVEGEPNSETRVELIEHAGGLGRYRLLPRTGKTHQLRLHMSSLGLPIVGDNFYPDFYDVAADDYSNPLQLLAASIEFDDPISGERRRFRSNRTLRAL